MAKKDRTGEINYNNFGSKMEIIRYDGCNGIDVYFPEYNWVYKNATYDNFKNGKIKCPYEPRAYGVGYIGEGKYKPLENEKPTRSYSTWQHMLMRCYSEEYQIKKPSYVDCSVCNEWHNFQNFAEWYEENYYEISGEKMQLDKDILFKGNKIYSPDTCIFVPIKVNAVFKSSTKNKFVVEQVIKEYKNKIPDKLYLAMLRWYNSMIND